MATAKLASDLRSVSKRPESASSIPTSEIYSWASQLASESREPQWISDSYVMPSEVSHLLTQLQSTHGALVGLVGFQGVGKSSALLAIATSLRQTKMPAPSSSACYDTILFKWRRTRDLYRSLMHYDHEASLEFRSKYGAEMRSLSSSQRTASYDSTNLSSRMQGLLQGLEKEFPWVIQVDAEEKRLGKTRVERTRKSTWHNILSQKHSIFIDMPDYSKTDRRLMAKDLEEIYWLWQSLNRFKGRFADSTPSPNIVIAIQKEMFHGHFFFDKMEKVELEPLKPEQMVEAYRKRFKAIDPFTEDALLTLSRMSRGIFRRFLRYITLTLRHWEIDRNGAIDATVVKEAVTVARLAEDMELELVELFPKHGDLRLLVVRLLMLLQESGDRKQSELADFLEVKPYELSRLLTKLEVAHYIARGRDGNDKIVHLCTAQNNNQTPQVLGRAIAVL